MNLLKNLFSAPGREDRILKFSVRCRRCGQVLTGQIDLYNDPSQEFDQDGTSFFFCRKVLIGSGPCFQSIEAVFRLDENRREVSRQVQGGEFS